MTHPYFIPEGELTDEIPDNELEAEPDHVDIEWEDPGEL